MAKQYTYDPRKYQSGGVTPPSMGSIQQGPTFMQNLGSDIRSVIKYPMESARAFLKQGEIPYNFDKGVEGGHVSTQPMDFAANMVNLPGAAYKAIESGSKGDYTGAAYNALSILPIARPLRSVGLNPSTAQMAGKVINKGTKGSLSPTFRYQGGGSVLNNKKLEKKYKIPTYDKFAEAQNIKFPDTTFFGYGDNKMEMVMDNRLNARIDKRLDENGNFKGTLPYMNQNFSMDNFVEFPAKKEGKPPLKVYYETYNQQELETGGQPDPNTTRMSRSAINAEIERIKMLQAEEAERIAQFQQNVQNQLGNYNTGTQLSGLINNDQTLNPAGQRDQKLIDSTKTIGRTYNWLDSRAQKGESFYGCTSYGCGILKGAGATLQGDINIAGRDYSAGDKLPIIGGNADMNGIIENNPAAMGMEVIDPQSYQDLVAGDRIVTNYGTGGNDGDQHTMIFSGQYDENGTPIIMQNRGGNYHQGISSASLNYGLGADDGIKVTRYTGDQQNLANELAGYQNRLDSGDFYIEPQPIMNNLQPQSVVPLAGASLEANPLEIAPPTMQSGGFLSPEYMDRQSLFGMGPGSALERQDFRLQGLQGRSSVIPGQGSLSGITPLTGQTGIQQQRLTNRMVNTGMNPTDITAAAQGGNKGMRQALRSQRMENFGNSAMGKMSGQMGMLGNLGSGLLLSQGDGTYDPALAKGAGALSGAGTGAQMGAALGPVGMAVGAVLGGIGGAIFGGQKAKKAENERKEKKENMLASNIAAGKTNDEARSAGVLSQYPTEGITSSYYAKMGGMMEAPEYVVEGGELMMAPNNNPPKTDNSGKVTQIGKNMFKFDGDTHDAPSGGIGVEGGNSEFASQTNQVLDSGFVFSARLKANPDDYLKNI